MYDVHFEAMKRIEANSEEEAEDIMWEKYGILAYEISNIQLTNEGEKG